MLQLTPQSRIFVAVEPVDFRQGIDGLGGVCRRALARNPLDGAVYVFRNHAGTGLKILVYDLGEAPRYVELRELTAA